jgi:hypothetical protein
MPFDYVASMTEGHKYGDIVAERLRLNGVRCTVPDLYIVQSREEIPEMTATEKDIILDDSGECLEVKSRNIEFTELKDFPWGNIIVDTVSGYEAKLQKPYAYVMVSTKTKGMFGLLTSTKDKWTVKQLHDKYRGHDDNFYVVDIEHCIPWEELVVFIKNLEEEQWWNG